MINLFIVAAISFLFWGKMTKEEEEKIENANWIRVMVYFVLSFLIGVFYYKTYQVATIKNYVQIEGFRSSHNKQTGEIVDTIEALTLKNRFTNSYHFSTFAKFSNSSDSSYESTDNLGGIFIVHKLMYDSLCEIRQHKDNVNNHAQGIGHNYQITYITTRIPVISFIQSKFSEKEDSFGSIKDQLLMRSITEDLKDIERSGEDDFFLNYTGSFGLLSITGEWTFNLDSLVHFEKHVKNTLNNKKINNLNFFTAADISQCSYDFGIYSECPIKDIAVNFDIPVEISPLPYTADEYTAYGFHYKDPEKLKELQNQILTLHIKFPTLANMQLIRSLILTTLLSALVSLFIANLYFLICKIIRCFKRKANVEHDPSKTLVRKKVYRTLAIILCVTMFVGGLLIIFDKYLWLSHKSLIIFLVILSLIFLALFYGVIKFELSTLKKTDDKKSKDKAK